MKKRIFVFLNKSVLLFLTLILVSSCHTTISKNIEKEIDYLFVFFDAGETFSLLPVIQKMENEKLNYKILLLGNGSVNAIAKEKYTTNIIDIKKECSAHFILAESTFREREMNNKILQEVANCYHPKKVITGLVSRYQSQLSEYYNKNSTTQLIGYYDGFSLPELKILTPFQNSLNQIFVPSKNISEYLQKKNIFANKIKVVGQPALDKFIEDANKIDSKEIKDKLNIKQETPIITFIGGYGKEYEEVFKTFVSSVKSIKNTKFIISIHPAANGNFEEKTIKDLNATNFIMIRKEIQTISLVKISNLVVSQRSTVGIQSLFIGVPSLYYDIKNTTYTNLAIQQGWSSQIHLNNKNFSQIIETNLLEKKSNALPNNIGEFIPKNAMNNIYELIVN